MKLPSFINKVNLQKTSHNDLHSKIDDFHAKLDKK